MFRHTCSGEPARQAFLRDGDRRRQLTRCAHPLQRRRREDPALPGPHARVVLHAQPRRPRRVRHGGDGIFPGAPRAHPKPLASPDAHSTTAQWCSELWPATRAPGARAARRPSGCVPRHSGRPSGRAHGSVAHTTCSCELDACHHGMSGKDELFSSLTHAPAPAKKQLVSRGVWPTGARDRVGETLAPHC